MSLYSNFHKPSEDADVFLSRLALFSQLAPDQRAQVAARAQRRSFAAGVTLYHQDMPGIMLYMIEEGSIRVFSIGRTGQELTLDVLGRGDILGVLSTLDNKPHSSSAITLSPTVVWLISRADFEDSINRFPGIARALIQILVERMRRTTQNIEAMTFQDVQGRLAYEILNLSERHGRKNASSIEISIPLTQMELASMVGATRESVNKALSALRSQNLIRAEGASMIVISPEGLRNIVFDRGR